MKGFLVLEDGQIFEGTRIGANGDSVFEVVFNTEMEGYIETLVDPAYAGQGIVMTYPLIGNYGVMKEYYENSKIWANAIFIHELAQFASNFRNENSLNEFLIKNNIPGLSNINTRKLTKVLRDFGTMKGMITSDISDINNILERIKTFSNVNVVSNVVSGDIEEFEVKRDINIAVLDFGCKNDVVNSLIERGVGVRCFPMNTSAKEILITNPDGIILSNGPR